jgi:hypothetical protein
LGVGSWELGVGSWMGSRHCERKAVPPAKQAAWKERTSRKPKPPPEAIQRQNCPVLDCFAPTGARNDDSSVGLARRPGERATLVGTGEVLFVI